MRTKFNKSKRIKSIRTKWPDTPKRIKRVRTKWPEGMIVNHAKPGSIFNKGGFLINPPVKCNYRKKCQDGGIWVDAVICSSTCNSKCSFFHNYCKMNYNQRLNYRRKYGVRI